MMNLDTLVGGNNSQFNDNVLQDMSEIICGAGQAVSCARYDAVTNMTLLNINRSGRGAFTSPFNQHLTFFFLWLFTCAHVSRV